VWAELVGEIARMLEAERVHGDLSAYNVLMHDGSPVVIDFPQACDPRFNANAFRLLLRDIENLARFFARLGIHRDASRLAERYWSAWERPG
jgi:RIO kinase 1